MTTLEEVFININDDLHNTEKSGKFGTVNGSEGTSLKGTAEKDVAVENHNQSGSFEVDKDSADGEEGEYLVRGSGCCTTVQASIIKRWNIYKRDYCGFICQVISPLILIFLGLLLSSGPSKLHQSPPKFLSTAFYPQQRIMLNEYPTYEDAAHTMPVADMWENFPNKTDFDVTWTNTSDYFQMYDEFYEFRNEEPLFPYRYGSYQVFQADNVTQQWQVYNYLNITSQDVTAFYPQWMYQTILRTATGNPDFTFNITTTPFPVFYAFKAREQAARTLDYVFMLSIALALIPCVVVSFILNEREKQLKHQQLISGMSMFGYWAANVISDIVASFVPILLIILLNYAFSSDTPYGWMFLCLYPLAVIPFSYITSFIFTDDTSAQICTLFLHFLAGGAFTAVIYVLQLLPITANLGDTLRYFGLIFPSFCVTHAFILSKDLPTLVKTRAGAISDQPDLDLMEWPDDEWAWFNLKADLVALIVHFCFGLIVLGIIESPLFDACKDCACCDKATDRDVMDMDEDMTEAERLYDERRKKMGAKALFRGGSGLADTAASGLVA